MHEYIHSLTTTNTSMASWKVEGFARYFSYYYDFYGMPFLNQDYNNTPNTPELKYIHEFLDAINRPIDMAKDYRELENIAVFSLRRNAVASRFSLVPYALGSHSPGILS